MRTWAITLWALLVGLVVTACEDCLGAPGAGGRIRGTVFMDGEVPSDFAAPGLVVAAVVEFPLTGAPHSTLILDDFDLSGGTEFELRDVPAYDYFVIARLRDLNEPPSPSDWFGAYPDFCSLQREPMGNVEVSEDSTVEGLEINLYDNSGFADPCTVVESICPREGFAAVVVEFEADFEATEDDVLIFGLFEMGLPSFINITPGDEVSFPYEVVDVGVRAGDYTIFTCYDLDGDDIAAGIGCGDNPSASYNDDEVVTFPAGKVVRLTADFGTGLIGEPVIEDPVGCEFEGMPRRDASAP